MTVDALDKVLQIIHGTIIGTICATSPCFRPSEPCDLMAKDKILIAQQPNFTYNLEGRYVETLEGKRLTTNNAMTTPIKNAASSWRSAATICPSDRWWVCTRR